MKCEEYQELILTDYIDGELAGIQKQRLEEHLADCAECREFAAAAAKSVLGPFENLQRARPPEAVWENIKEAIEETRRPAAGPASGFLERWKSLLPEFRPAFTMGVAAMIIAVVLFSFSTGKQRQVRLLKSAETADSIDYIAYVFEEAENTQVDENGGYGTSIEEYFL